MANKKEPYNNVTNPEEPGSELSKIKIEQNFQVPENYFVELPQIIQEKVIQRKVQFDMHSIFNYFTNPYRAVVLGSLLAVLLVGIFILSNQKNENQISVEFSFEEMMEIYPDLIEYMDDQVLIEFVAVQMDQKEFDFIDYEIGFDSILIQNEVIPLLSDEEISEIIYNL